ncbi:MAG: hypothetical protein KBD60_10125 [Sterolibacterium sp.]|nr:hypothetical protein [Sterolibacterium sp.]
MLRERLRLQAGDALRAMWNRMPHEELTPEIEDMINEEVGGARRTTPAGRQLMRLMLDTNVVVAGLLWQEPPRHLLDQAIDGHVSLFSNISGEQTSRSHRRYSLSFISQYRSGLTGWLGRQHRHEKPPYHALVLRVVFRGLRLEELNALFAQSQRYLHAFLTKCQFSRGRKKVRNYLNLAKRFIGVLDFSFSMTLACAGISLH